MNSRLTKLENTWATVRHSDNDGCLSAIGKATAIEEFDRLHKLHLWLCPIKYNQNIACNTECVFSCVDQDADLMSKVLRTLPTE